MDGTGNLFMEKINEKVMIYDGSKGYMLQQIGLEGGECPELWNVEKPEKITELYCMYKEAGADVIQTNTFQGSRVQLKKYALEDRMYELNFEGARLARQVMDGNGFVAGSIGPLGKLFEPSGELTFEEAYEAFALQVRALADGGVDAINLETFTDIAEIRAALLASIETTGLPVICSLAFESNGRTLMGTDPFNAAITLKALGASMVGTNCSSGILHQLEILKIMDKAGTGHLSVKPNAGLPEVIDGKTVYMETPKEFAEISPEYVRNGARLVGGCCGTTPEHIEAIANSLKGVDLPRQRSVTDTRNIVTSAFEAREIGGTIGSIFASLTDMFSLKRIEQALEQEEAAEDIAMEAMSDEYDILVIDMDVVPEGKRSRFPELVNLVQGYVKQPIVFKTTCHKTLEKALRVYRGRAGVDTGDCRKSVLKRLLPVMEKYGCQK